jgi:hypothetical protein
MQDIEIKLLRIFRGKYGRYTATVELHPNDLTPEITEALYAEADAGTPYKMRLMPLTEEKPKTEEKKKQTIYQWFKWQCEELGLNYAEEKEKLLKQYALQTDHMKNLETIFKPLQIDTILRDRLFEIKSSIGLFN